MTVLIQWSMTKSCTIVSDLTIYTLTMPHSCGSAKDEWYTNESLHLASCFEYDPAANNCSDNDIILMSRTLNKYVNTEIYIHMSDDCVVQIEQYTCTKNCKPRTIS